MKNKMKPPEKNKLEIENDAETFQKLIALVNLYSETFYKYQKIFYMLNNLPRTKGEVILEENYFEIFKEYLSDYQSLTAYAQKVMSKEDNTLH